MRVRRVSRRFSAPSRELRMHLPHGFPVGKNAPSRELGCQDGDSAPKVPPSPSPLVLPSPSNMAEADLHIFPTSSRSKHSKEVSYPIGAEGLSHALEGVPQHDWAKPTLRERITCDFYGGRPHDDGKPQIYVLNARYEKQARRFSDSGSALERGVFDPHWKISVFGVPRQLRGEIKLLLIEQGLPNIVRPWLISKSHLTGQTGGSALWLEYVRADKNFTTTLREEIAPDRSG